MHDGDIDQHDHPEAQGVHQQRQRAGDKNLAERRLGRTHGITSGQYFLLPGVGHLHGMGHTDGKDQERHQYRHRVDTQAQQWQQAE